MFIRKASRVLIFLCLTYLLGSATSSKKLRGLGDEELIHGEDDTPHGMHRSLQQQSKLCPIGTEEKVIFTVKPNGNQFSEVSYMAYSSQTYHQRPVLW